MLPLCTAPGCLRPANPSWRQCARAQGRMGLLRVTCTTCRSRETTWARLPLQHDAEKTLMATQLPVGTCARPGQQARR